MNPLQTLIADELIEQNIKRSELVKRMGYSNISKGLRKLDALLETLEHQDWLLPLLQKALNIPDERFQTAVSAFEDEIFEEQSVIFKPYIQVVLAVRPSFLSVMGGIMHINVPENTPSSSDSQQISVVRGLCRAYRDEYSGVNTKGFIYHRSYGESLRLDNHLTIVKHG